MRGPLATFLLIGLAALPAAQALPLAAPSPILPSDPTPNAPYAAWVRFEVDLLPALDAFSVRTLALVEEAPLENTEGVPAQLIREGGPAAHQIFEERVQILLDAQLRAAFPGSAPVRTRWTVDYRQTDADPDPFKPGILVDTTSRVPVTPSALGIPGVSATTGPELARAFLYSGGRLEVSRSVQVPPGVSATVAVFVPPFLQLARSDGANATHLEFPRDNLQGARAQPLDLRFRLGAKDETMPQNVREGPLVRAAFLAHDETPLWMQAFPLTHGRFSADLDLWIDLSSLPASLFEDLPLPAGLELSTVSADLLRVAVRERLLSADDLHAYFALLIEKSLREGFGESVVVSLDPGAFEESVAAPLGSGTAAGVTPIRVHATAHLPLKSEKMLWASAIGRAVGMLAGMPASFPVDNGGSWSTELTLLYPPGVDIEVTDSLGRAQKIVRGDREGFLLTLRGDEKTEVHVKGQAPFDPVVFALGVLEILALAFVAWRLVTKVRELRRSRRFPWSPAKG